MRNWKERKDRKSLFLDPFTIAEGRGNGKTSGSNIYLGKLVSWLFERQQMSLLFDVKHERASSLESALNVSQLVHGMSLSFKAVNKINIKVFPRWKLKQMRTTVSCWEAFEAIFLS